MGLFNKKAKPPLGPINHDFPPSGLKEIMKGFGMVPGEGLDGFFGWTEDDYKETKEIALLKKKNALEYRMKKGCSLREEMELEIQIDGLSN